MYSLKGTRSSRLWLLGSQEGLVMLTPSLATLPRPKPPVRPGLLQRDLSTSFLKLIQSGPSTSPQGPPPSSHLFLFVLPGLGVATAFYRY